jgi:hypothetical protein
MHKHIVKHIDNQYTQRNGDDDELYVYVYKKPSKRPTPTNGADEMPEHRFASKFSTFK